MRISPIHEFDIKFLTYHFVFRPLGPESIINKNINTNPDLHFEYKQKITNSTVKRSGRGLNEEGTVKMLMVRSDPEIADGESSGLISKK